MKSRDVTFFENIFPLKNKLSKYVCDTFCSNLSSCSNANMDIVFKPKRSKRSKKVNDFGFEFCLFLLEDDPKTYGEVMRSIDASFWKETINDEMSSLKINKNWMSDSDETKSTSGYVFTLAGDAVSWKSVKQTIISRSTMEAEIIFLDTATSEAEFLKNLLCDLSLLNKSIPPISMHCDSQVAISKVTSKNFNEKRRHLRVRHKSIRNLISHSVISLDFVRSKNNIADPLTKGLTRQQGVVERNETRAHYLVTTMDTVYV